MKYEFLIQAVEPQAPYTPEAVEGLLDQKGATTRPDGVRVLRLKSGEVETRRCCEGQTVVGTEVKVPMTDSQDLVREAFLATMDLATAAGMRVVDPQLSRSLKLADEHAVADAYTRSAEYAGRYAGVSSAISASFGEQQSPLSPGLKLALILIAVGVVLYLIVTP